MHTHKNFALGFSTLLNIFNGQNKKLINFAIKKFKKSTTSQKLHSFVKQDLKVYQNIRILEFGVDKGISTSFFLDICKKNKGRLISVDTINYEKLYSFCFFNMSSSS